ncbi:hypothetical protein PBI_ZONIA_54 [Mycobacterium phage Zonia]|uniref:Uncharacterized protein n=27 Tax=Caudoviricetes TaxID=2731619 RepID=A0A345KXJ9_9CAUD|nr:hypothetical protein KNT94_gp45 [Mycobacterium phage KingTut]AIM50483.1 hypothetical protein PBI_ZONIA_54 [Mycobacterium phage Zonia]AOQ28614.1 hypothetical protein SEA_DERPP_52 [Mycobacterium phage Derpp]ASR75695.1 hypothetical protein SEA_LEMONSLICE_54 [Mycobacterium phage LemonSlice]ATN89668.1 hypothetical protein SEA_KAILASH_53 [Mycobacterium phage Kailash]ATN92374.1 hypothetical protein SEA_VIRAPOCALYPSE_54 [Mycobacterium phage Virapocalypse]AVO24710.1 hypothetical protein SEA_BATTERY
MNDPAVEAAQRAMRKVHDYPRPNHDLITAAREALKPIRELHRPRWSNCINACCSGEDCRLRDRVCEHCEVDWPCDTAKLIYTTEAVTMQDCAGSGKPFKPGTLSRDGEVAKCSACGTNRYVRDDGSIEPHQVPVVAVVAEGEDK